MKSRSRKLFHSVIAILCTTLCATLFSPASIVLAQQAQSQVMTTTEQTPTLASGELDSLVAPIALYSDPLLAQTLAASTYPLEIIQLQQWMDRNKNLKGKALADAVAKQPWDPSVQGLVEFPDVVQRMAGNVQWTTDLGNAFLAQQSDVMDAVQRMRAKAQGTGNLKTSAQQTVQTETVSSGKQVIAIEPANPEVVYVPSYRPDGGVRTCSRRVSLLSLYVSGLRARDSFNVGRWNCARCRRVGRLGWPLGQLRLERWQRQDQQQL